MLNFTKKLISFNTTQIENDAMEYIWNYAQEIYGDAVKCERQDIWDQNRYNLIIKNTEDPDIILAGHIDTVPEFSQEQFIPKIEGNKLYGRWAVDMKAGVAINVELIAFMLKEKIKFRVLCYTDEEYFFLWMQKFVETYQWKIHPKLTIVTEPTNGKIYTWCRGIGSVDLEIKWKSVHSARKHLWINAITEYVYSTDALEKYIQSKDTFGYESSINLSGIEWGIYQDGKIIWQDNIVPNIAKGNFSLRLGNEFTREALQKFMQEYFAEKEIKILDINPKVWCKPLIQTGLKEKYKSYGEVEEGYTFGFSDIQFIKEYMGGDCLLIWPGPNGKSHQADEYVDIDSMKTAKVIIENILKSI